MNQTRDAGLIGTPTTRAVFHEELVKLDRLTREGGFLSPYSMARAAGVPATQMRKWLRGNADPGTPWERDRVLVAIVNTLRLRPI